METSLSSVIGKLKNKKIHMINNDDNTSPRMEPQKINYYKIKQIVKNQQQARSPIETKDSEEEEKKPVVEKTTQCLTCNGMKDFITSLQREIQRLHGVTTGLTK